ncbi:MAG: Sua5/YciO/YrdC/YwlC family protein, partial [Candidatus Methanoplasma sp.]|nr:Sua5/YciO/YrdC/YwlC family protein [Candidatus Methanoplasma sp.]
MRIIFKGVVQGVGFRPAVYRTATNLGLSGKVWNDGSDVIVEVDDGERFLKHFLADLPPLARLEDVVRIEQPVAHTGGFKIISSRAGSSGMSIPADTAVCDDCLSDMKAGRRMGYPFTTCTKCGPRFTLLSGLPYDRSSTAMRDFPLCRDCQKEYDDPADRRFHHQTSSCPKCGPSYRLIDKEGKEIRGDPISNFSNMLSEGKICIIKGWGGMHICCTLDHIKKMREWYGRDQKPFAIMVKDVRAVRKYGDPTDKEVENLTSPHRPIVLIEKKHSAVTELISPGLDNIGIFLPYTGAQHLVFEHLAHDALIMTSANVPGEPMIIEDKEILGLGADMYLIHNQKILNRADDSVLRLFDERTFFIRRSRGHVPSYIPIPLKGSAVAVGAQENLTGSIAVDGRIHPTQHIGDGEGIGVVDYLEDAVREQMKLLGCRPQAVAMDI